MKYPVILWLAIFLVSCGSNNTETSELLGTWELVRYENTTEDTIENTPENEDSIKISFRQGNFEGNTSKNEFFGEYSTASELLIFENFNGSEAGETAWGEKFFDAVVTTYNSEDNSFSMPFSINDNILKFEYVNSQFMVFKKM